MLAKRCSQKDARIFGSREKHIFIMKLTKINQLIKLRNLLRFSEGFCDILLLRELFQYFVGGISK